MIYETVAPKVNNVNRAGYLSLLYLRRLYTLRKYI